MWNSSTMVGLVLLVLLASARPILAARQLPASVVHWASDPTATSPVAAAVHSRQLRQAASGQGVLLTTGLTKPQGLVYIPPLKQYWISDSVLGVTQLSFATTNPPATGRLDASAPAGMAFYTFTRPAGPAAHLYVADASSKSNNVFRYTVTAAGLTLDRTFVVPPPDLGTGRKAKAGRCVAVAIIPNKTGGKDLYVGFIKTGQIVRVSNVDKVGTTDNFAVEGIGSSIAGGLSSMLAYKNDLLLGESGGVVSLIADPSGVTGRKCNGVCGAVKVDPAPCASPGALATDPTFSAIYCGEFPLVVGDSRVFRSTMGGPSVVYSSSVSPGNTKYQLITTLAVDENGDLLVAFDPQAAADASGAGRLVRVKAYTPGSPGTGGGGGGGGGTPPGEPVGAVKLFAWGVTAPDGGATYLPKTDSSGVELVGQGTRWISDHAQGLCRMDILAGAPVRQAATNWDVCGPVAVGSPGQLAYDKSPVMKLDADGNPTSIAVDLCLHYVYVGSNAAKSTAVFRLTYDACKMTMVADPNVTPPQRAVQLPGTGADERPNGLALHPTKGLFIATLKGKNLKRIPNPSADPRVHSIEDVAETNDGRGISGTISLIGNILYVAGSETVQFIDVTQCPLTTAAGAKVTCGMGSVPAPAGVTAGGVAVDAAEKVVYFSDAPGDAPSTVYKYDARFDTYTAFQAGTVQINRAVGPLLCGTRCNPAGLCAAVPIPAGAGVASCRVGPQASVFFKEVTIPAAQATAYVEIGTSGGGVSKRPWDTDYLGPVPTGTADYPTDLVSVAGLTFLDSDGVLVVADDKAAGERSGRGTVWEVKTK